MDDRSRKWEDRRRLEREGDEMIKLLVKHEEKEAEEKREKKAEERWVRWEEKRERRTEERWAKWEDRQRLERQGDEIVEMIRRHEEEEEGKRRQTEGMSAGDEYRMMLMMAEKHVLEASQHREMVEEEAQKGIKETREKVAMEMKEMIEKGYGNVTFGSKKIRPGEFFERKKGELERSEAENGQAAEDRVLSRHLAEANRDEKERRIQGKGKSGNMAEEREGGEIARSMSEEIVSPGHDATVFKEKIVTVSAEEIDREETMTQATVVETMIVAAARQNEDVVAVSDDMMTMTTDEAGGVRNDEQTLLEQLLQGNGMGENCEEQKDVEEKYEGEGSLQSKAKAVADCIIQTQQGEMVETGREGSIMTHEKSVPEVERPYFVMSKREQESRGVDEECIQVTRKSMDALLEKVKQVTEMTVNSTILLSGVMRETKFEKNVGVNPKEVVQDDVMDCERKRGDELPVDEPVRNLREEMAEMSLRVERLERNMPLGCEESESSSGGGEWAWWSGAWWVKTKTRMNSASRRKVHRAISQSRCWLNGLVGKGGSREFRAHIRPFGLKGCALPQKEPCGAFWILGNSFAMLRGIDAGQNDSDAR